MIGSIYGRLAGSNVRKNSRFYIPRILTEAGLLACYYIILTLTLDKRLASVKGGNYIPTLMQIGALVMTILSVILLLYTNSFLMKQRKREFGLYNVLGLEKKHIIQVLFHETLISGLAGIVLGIMLGVLLYKLCALIICRLLAVDVVTGFYYISKNSLIPAIAVFVGIDAVAFAINCITITRMKPVEMLASVHVGEKEPKIRWILLIVGAVSLTAGYFIALTTQNPLVAMTKFLVAVILVIIGTYALFVTGTIFVLKMLKKRKKFYYSKNHMTAVSGLLYRMKQNAVGLASITVLACGVLVMLSTTLSLYVGLQDSLAHNFPQDWYVSASYIDNDDNWVEIPLEDLASIINEAAPVYGETITEEHVQRYLEVAYAMDGNNLITDLSQFNSISNFGSLCAVIFVTAQDYLEATGVNLTLSDGEIGICKMNVNSEDAFQETLLIDGRSYRIAETLEQFYIRSDMGNAVNCYGVVVSDENALNEIYEMQKESYGKDASSFTKRLAIKFSDRNRLFDVGDDMYRSVKTHVYDYMEQFSNKTAMGFTSDSVWETRKEMYGLYGTLLFLGMLLGIVFLFATALIIYYKQISEGYEDRERFQIMEKIGMSQSEVKTSIHGQILLVFFMPLVVAGVHVAVAFQMLLKMLKLLLLSSTWAFAGCAVGAFAVFSIVYAAIYMATARTYYRIVK